ncbi:MAG: hypothetical protein CK424_08445 [Legionella sp.]|nr:MAG: hypothetical protein CK424_08445 [Legionella sp.]
MIRARKKIYFKRLLLCWLLTSATHAAAWQTLAPGIEYDTLDPQPLSQWSHIHVFRIDLHHNQLGIVLAKDLPKNYTSAQTFGQHSQALIALNGGFFNPNKVPLGLRLSDHQILNPLKRISWWWIFSIKQYTAAITSPYEFRRQNSSDFAIQAGPRLLIAGKIPALKPGFANRSALGIDTQGRILIVVTENLPMTTTDLAYTLKNAPLNCVDALNLDGGSSSQLYANMPNFKLNVPGFAQVSDAIVVKPR